MLNENKKLYSELNVRPSEGHSQSQENEAVHILIIDDSNHICSTLVTAIVRACAESGRSCQIIQSGPFGMIETVPMWFAPKMPDPHRFNIYIANSPRNALQVLNLPDIQHLTIICDIIMPSDTQVGLFGLLSALTSHQLPVNLLFASSEGQSREFVAELLKNRKAYFVEKGTSAWLELPYALVQRNKMFQYRVLERSDYDKGRLRLAAHNIHLNRHQAIRAAASNTRLTRKVETSSLPVQELANAKVEAVAPVVPASPRMKNSTGLLSILAFWRWGKNQAA